MATSGKTVDPILIGIIALGVVGVGAFYFLSSNQEIAPLPEPEQPNLARPQASSMAGNPAMWGSGEQQGDMGGGMPMGPAVGPGVGAPAGPPQGGVSL